MKPAMRYVRHHHLGLLALFVALGGTSYAAVKLPKDSVGATQIRAGAVSSSEVKDGSLRARDFKASELPSAAAGAAGPQGAKGEKGDTGAQGPAGADGAAESIAVRVRQTSDSQTVAGTPTGAAMTPVAFPDPAAEQYDLGGFFDAALVTTPPTPAGNSIITIPKTGTYVVTAGVRWAANADGVRSLAINGPQPGGVRAQSTVPANPAPGAATAQNVATSERFQAGDVLFASVGHSVAGDLLLDASQNQIHLSATYVGP